MYTNSDIQRTLYTLKQIGALFVNLSNFIMSRLNDWTQGLDKLLKFIGCIFLETNTISQFINNYSAFKIFTDSLLNTGF
jgi:hypothetical protein